MLQIWFMCQGLLYTKIHCIINLGTILKQIDHTYVERYELAPLSHVDFNPYWQHFGYFTQRHLRKQNPKIAFRHL